MGAIKVNYLITRTHKGKKRYYWNPKKKYVINGVITKSPFKMIRLPDDKIEAATKVKEFNEQLELWRKGEDTKPKAVGSIDWLIIQYKKSSRYRELADSTQRLYQWNFPLIAQVFRRIPVSKVSRPMALALYEKLRESGHKRKPSQVMQIARVLFQYAEDVGQCASNPFTRQNVKKAKPRQVIIDRKLIALARTQARIMGLPSIAKAIQIGYDAGQRPGDIRTAPKRNYNGRTLTIVQSKTGVVVEIPVYKYPDLKAELDDIGHDSTLILHEERTGRAYSKDMLCRRVREVFNAIPGGEGIQFRDLRRTCVVRMAEAGCTVPEICATTGHTLQEAHQILEVYLPRNKKMAENAANKVQKLNKSLATSRIKS